jgi:hypothetical protein
MSFAFENDILLVKNKVNNTHDAGTPNEKIKFRIFVLKKD